MDTHTLTCDLCKQEFVCDLPQPHTCKAICIPCLKKGLEGGTIGISMEVATSPVTIKSDGPMKMVDER